MSLFDLLVCIRDAQFRGYQRTQLASPWFCFTPVMLFSAWGTWDASIETTVPLFLGRTCTVMTRLQLSLCSETQDQCWQRQARPEQPEDGVLSVLLTAA